MRHVSTSDRRLVQVDDTAVATVMSRDGGCVSRVLLAGWGALVPQPEAAVCR